MPRLSGVAAFCLSTGKMPVSTGQPGWLSYSDQASLPVTSVEQASLPVSFRQPSKGTALQPCSPKKPIKNVTCRVAPTVYQEETPLGRGQKGSIQYLCVLLRNVSFHRSEVPLWDIAPGEEFGFGQARIVPLPRQSSQ